MHRLGLVALVLAASCKAGAPGGKTITVGAQQEPDSLWLPFREMIAADEVLRAGAMTLTVFNEKWELVPHAATDIPTVENGGVKLLPDGRMTTDWTLRDDLRWADGVPLTADDFVFAVSVWKDSRLEIADRTYAEHIEKAEALGPDRRTLRITWKDPYAYFANYRNLEALPRHLVEPLLRDVGPALKQHPMGLAPALAGPFVVQQWERGQFITLQKNPHLQGPGAARVDKLVFRIIPETTALENALLAGTIDAVSPVGMHVDQVLEIQKRHADRFDFHFADALQWEHITLNLADPWLADVRMRRALLLAVDRARMSSVLFGGRQKVAHGPVPDRHADALPTLAHIPFDPAAARALLDEMGFVPGPDGIRVKDGQRLRFTIASTSGVTTRERVEEVLQGDWRNVGIELVVENVPARVLFGELLRHRKFKHMVMFAWAQDPLRISDAQFRCDMIPTQENAWQGQNYGAWCDQEATTLFKQANVELDATKRRALLHRAQERWAEQLPAIPLYFRSEASITRKGFQNWKPTGTLTPVTWNAHQWALP